MWVLEFHEDHVCKIKGKDIIGGLKMSIWLTQSLKPKKVLKIVLSIIVTLIALWIVVLPGNLSAENLPLTDVFTPTQSGYNTVCIPTIAKTASGTLLAFCEGREGGDFGDTAIILRRSADNGDSWMSQQVLWEEDGHTVGNPCPLVDEDTGRIHLICQYDNVSQYYCYSDNDGLSWSNWVNITSTFEDFNFDWERALPGPINGIKIKKGSYAGRLVYPVWLTDSTGFIQEGYDYYSAIIYSDDGGSTWEAGGMCPRTAEIPDMNECTVYEKDNGALILNMRVCRKTGIKLRAMSESTNGGITWSNPWLCNDLITPTCNSSAFRYSFSGDSTSSIVLFAGPNSTINREKMTVKKSIDGGYSWPVEKQIYSGPAGYSCLTKLSNDKIGILFNYGTGNYYEKIAFTSFTLEWLENNLLYEDWDSTSAWDTSGTTVEISPAGQLHLYDNTRTVTTVQKSDLSIGGIYTLEFKAKVDDFTAGSLDTNLGTSVRDGSKRLMLRIRSDGIYAITATSGGSWVKVKDRSMGTAWYTYRVEVNNGSATVYIDNDFQCNFSMQNHTGSDLIQHWVYAPSSDSAECHIDYTVLSD